MGAFAIPLLCTKPNTWWERTGYYPCWLYCY